jgi:hypothetical protein
MKSEFIAPTSEDRLATLEEVRHATSTSPDGLLALCHNQGNYCEVNSDLGGFIRYSTEEFEFFASLSETDEEVAN